MEKDFWRKKRPHEMSPEEWEAVCDGCGRCCLHKLQDEETLEVVYTWVACRHLDGNTCRCRSYEIRKVVNKQCLHLTPQLLDMISWLPDTCAYRLLKEGRDLPGWHPLVSGDPASVHEAGISVRHRTLSEDDVPPDDFESYLMEE